MGKPLHEVTDEDLARNGLADFSINPRPVMPWRTVRHRLTGMPPSDEEWQTILARYTDEAIALRAEHVRHPERFLPHYGRF